MHINNIAVKLVRVNAMLYKIRDYVNQNALKSIYFALFESHMAYAPVIWGQNIFTIKIIFLLQKCPKNNAL